MPDLCPDFDPHSRNPHGAATFLDRRTETLRPFDDRTGSNVVASAKPVRLPGPRSRPDDADLAAVRCVGSFIGRCGLINAEGVRHHPAWMQVPPDESLEEL